MRLGNCYQIDKTESTLNQNAKTSHHSPDKMDEFVVTQSPQRSNQQKKKKSRYAYNYKDIELVTEKLLKTLHPDGMDGKLDQTFN